MAKKHKVKVMNKGGVSSKQRTDGLSKALLVVRWAFLLVTLLIAVLQMVPWSAPLAIVEIPLYYFPTWLPLLLLVPLIWFWRRMFKLPKLQLTVLIFGVTYIVFQHMDFRVPFKRLALAEEVPSLRVLSVNLARVDALKFSALLRYQQPDVIVTQEIQRSQLVMLLAELMQPGSTEPKRVNNSGREVADGSAWRVHCELKLCLASRFQFTFVEAQSRRFREAWGVLGAAYDLDVDGEPLRIFNVHLETVRKGFEDISLTQIDLPSILENAKNRKIEAELLASWIGQQQPVVVVGDFNMTRGESLYREYFDHFRNAYSEVGFGFGHTKSTRLLSVRIDHLLTTLDVLPVVAKVGIDVGSDHRPLLVDLALGR